MERMTYMLQILIAMEIWISSQVLFMMIPLDGLEIMEITTNPPTVYTIAQNVDSVREITVADMDNDVIWISFLLQKMTILLLGMKKGEPRDPHLRRVIATSADNANDVQVADLDGDSLDIVSASSLDDTIAWYENDEQLILLGLLQI